jgi:hypothetical protein
MTAEQMKSAVFGECHEHPEMRIDEAIARAYASHSCPKPWSRAVQAQEEEAAQVGMQHSALSGASWCNPAPQGKPQ